MTKKQVAQRGLKRGDLVVEEIKRWITGRNLNPGEKLPKEAELQEMFGVSRGTLRRAIDELVRDGLLSALLILDFMARTGKRPSELLADLYARVGVHEYDRVDITVRTEEKAAIEERVRTATPKEVAGLRVESRDQVDGYRFNLEGGWWLLMRFSGTEPLLRIYAEMPSAELVQRALSEGQQIAGVTL